MLCKNHHENFQNENPINNEKEQVRSGAKTKKILNTKGKVNVNGLEVIQTIHCSYRLGDFCRS